MQISKNAILGNMSEAVHEVKLFSGEKNTLYTINAKGLYELASAAVYIDEFSGRIYQQAGRWVKDKTGRLLNNYNPDLVGTIGIDHDSLDWVTYYVTQNGENYDVRVERG